MTGTTGHVPTVADDVCRVIAARVSDSVGDGFQFLMCELRRISDTTQTRVVSWVK
jgi:hypothetical protein